MVESIFVLYHTRRKPFGPSASESEAPCLHLLQVKISHRRKDTPNRPRTSADMAESMVGAWLLSGDFEPGRSAEQPHIPSFTRQGLPVALEFEFLRWLAWSHMGGGLLSDWHCFPMGPYDDELLSHLRRGQYPTLTRFEGLGAGLFAGEKTQIDNPTKDALLNLKLNTFKS